MTMTVLRDRTPRNTGPIELRDLGPNGRPLGTRADCYDGSPWELHRGELVRQMSSNGLHSILMFLLGTLYRTHARDGLDVMGDVFCELVDPDGTLSLRAPDVVLARSVKRLKDGPFQGIPIVAVEIRATQSKKQLEEKAKLYLEHDWPCIWLVHADRQEVEIVRPNIASVVYPRGTSVPLVPELDKYELEEIPVAALFDKQRFESFCDGWVERRAAARERANERVRSLRSVLDARKFVVTTDVYERIVTSKDLERLERWLVLAATATSTEAFERGVRADMHA